MLSTAQSLITQHLQAEPKPMMTGSANSAHLRNHSAPCRSL